MRLRRKPEDQNFGDSRRARPAEVGNPQYRTSAAGTPTAVRLSSSISHSWLRLRSQREWVLFGFLSIVTFLCYSPCLNGQFVWDDDAWTIHLQKLFRDLSGLGTIWTNPTALQQYYPLTATTFWLDYHLWGFWTLPYHVENLLLHLLGVFLFWKVLRCLEVRGAWLACAILALHPMMVESVGWITERKNVLSMVCFLGALLCYGDFASYWWPEQVSSVRNWRSYTWSLIFFLAAYLAKATAFSFPAVLLLVCWWKRGQLQVMQDVVPTFPFFMIALGLGALTSWLERTHVGASGPDWDLSFAERCLIAGRALWFYVGKLLWPSELCFIYPRWHINGHQILQWIWPLLAVFVTVSLWGARKRIGRGPLSAVLIFAGSLFPLLGFMNGYFMRYSFVCDHWAYLPSLSLIALGAASVTRLSDNFSADRAFYVSTVLVLLAFAILTWRHSGIFADSETLYLRTLARNPAADLAHNNLGLLLFRAGEPEQAIAHFEAALQIRPASAHAHNNLANAYRVTGRPDQAVVHYETSLKLDPENANTWNNLALLLATSSDPSVRNGPRAIELAQHAKQMTQNKNAVVLATLAAAYAEGGRFADAVKTVEAALELISSSPSNSLVQALQSQLDLYLRGIPYHERADMAVPSTSRKP